jgi:hypothetical protein
MIKGIRPPEKVLALARKLKVPTTSLIWGTGAREYLKTSFIETLIRSRLKKKPKPRKHKPIPIPLGYNPKGSKRLQEKIRIWEKEEFKRLKKKFGKKS